MPLPANDAITRLTQNEERFDKFINGTTAETYSTNETVPRTVETISKFLNRMEGKVGAGNPVFSTIEAAGPAVAVSSATHGSFRNIRLASTVTSLSFTAADITAETMWFVSNESSIAITPTATGWTTLFNSSTNNAVLAAIPAGALTVFEVSITSGGAKQLTMTVIGSGSGGGASVDYVQILSTGEYLSNTLHRGKTLVPDINVNLKISSATEFTVGWWAIVDCPTSKMSLTSEHATTRLYPVGSTSDESANTTSVTFQAGERILLYVDPANVGKIYYKRVSTDEAMGGLRTVFTHESSFSFTDDMSAGTCIMQPSSATQNATISIQSTGNYRSEYHCTVTNFSSIYSFEVKPGTTGSVFINGVLDGKVLVRPFETVHIIKQIDNKFIVGGVGTLRNLILESTSQTSTASDVTGTQTLDMNAENVERLKLIGNTTFTPSLSASANSGRLYIKTVRFKQDATGGRVVTLASSSFGDATPPSPLLPVAANAEVWIRFWMFDLTGETTAQAEVVWRSA